MNHAERMRLFDTTDLYVVITEAFCAERSALEVLDRVLAAGVKIVQLREKACKDRELFERAIQFREKTREAGALLIVDDRLDIAMAVGADGVHLGQDDLPVDVARRLAPDLIIGASTHNLDEALLAQEKGASYVNIGPIFTTQTKLLGSGPVGLEMIDIIVPHLRIPWTTMGGINSQNIERVLEKGAKHVAVVTAVTTASDVSLAARELREKILAVTQR